MEPRQLPQATRTTLESNSFLFEEKFDTWLDLSDLLKLQEICTNSPSWSSTQWQSYNEIISPDSRITLQALGFLPVEISSAYVTPTLVSMLIRQALSSSSIPSSFRERRRRDWRESVLVASINSFNIQLSHLLSNTSSDLAPHLSANSENLTSKMMNIPPQVERLYWLSEEMNILIGRYKELYSDDFQKIAKKTSPSPHMVSKFKVAIPMIGCTFFLSRDLILCYHSNKLYLCNKSLFLEIYNKLVELYVLMLYSHMIDGNTMPKGHYTIVVKFILHLANKVRLLGGKGCRQSPTSADLASCNKGFVYLKMMEGLGVAELIHRNDYSMGWDNMELRNTLWNSVVAEQLDMNRDYYNSELNSVFSLCTTAQIAEILGLVKICGHPSIEIRRGLDKLYERTHADIEVDRDAVGRSECILKRDLFIAYYRRHRRFPLHTFQETVMDNQAIRFLSSRTDPTTEGGWSKWRTIPLEHWADIELEKNEEFDPFVNQLPLLKDKAAGLTRSKIMQLLSLVKDEESLLEQTEYKKKLSQRKEDRKVLLQFLLNPYFTQEFQDYLHKYQHDIEWTSTVLDYLVIKLTAKELEEKPEGRMFGASPVVERNRRVVQEYNMMSWMDKYMPEQLMTPNELAMIKKLYSFRHIARVYPHHVAMQISFDFSKWNNNMRHESIDIPAGNIFDKWFGTNLYGKTMKAFEHSLVYYMDKLRCRHWDGQLGGIEGLNQATWSTIFCAGLKSCIETLGMIYQMSVKGDDVRAVVLINRDVYNRVGPEALKNDLLRELQVLCDAMGWQLNPQECFVSLSLICTSKQYQVKDTWLPASSKKMMKCMSLSNLVFPTLEDIISSVYSTAHSSCSQSTSVIACYLTATIIAAGLLLRETHRRERRSKILNTSELTILLLWPQILGGPGSLPLQTFIVRGENDMLSISISLLRHIYMDSSVHLHLYAKRILSIPFDSKPDMSLLIADPYSIKLAIPEKPSAILRRMLRDRLKGYVKHTDIKILLNQNTEELAKRFKTTLLSCTPYLAKLVTCIWENSPFYIIEEILSKFCQSSTIFELLCHSPRSSRQKNARFAYRSLNAILNAAEKRLNHWLDVIRNTKRLSNDMLGVSSRLWDDPRICTTQIVHLARRASWDRDIVGITYPSLVDQNLLLTPQDIENYFDPRSVEGCMSSIIVPLAGRAYQTDDQSDHYATFHSHIPWLGSITSSKVDLPNIALNVRSITLSKILKLVNIRRLGEYVGDDFKRVLDNVLTSLTITPINKLIALTPESPGGHIAHRLFINSFAAETMPNYRPNLAQLSYIHDEDLVILQSDHRNRTINFAARHFYLTLMAVMPLQWSQNLPPTHPRLINVIFHGHVNSNHRFELCQWCCNIVDDEHITFNTTTLPDLSCFQTLPMVGASVYDEMLLNQALDNMVEGRAQLVLQEMNLDLDNPILVSAACNLVIHNLGKTSMQIHDSARGAGFDRVPAGPMLEILSSALGTTSQDNPRLSINLIRAMPPAQLYHALTVSVFQWYVQWISQQPDDTDVIRISLMQAHFNPLATMFGKIILAGVLHKISQGSADLNYIRNQLIWDAGSTNNANIASKCFIRQHINLFENWTLVTGPPFRSKCYTRFESVESLVTLVETYTNEYKRLWVWHLRQPMERASPLVHVVNWLQRICQSDSLDIDPEATIFDEEKQALLADCVINWHNRNTPGREIILNACARFIVMAMLDSLVIEVNNREILESARIINTDLVLAELNENFLQDEIPILENAFQESLFYEIYSQKMNYNQYANLVHLCNSLFTVPEIAEYMFSIITYLVGTTIPRTEWKRRLEITRLSWEDAERILKSNLTNTEDPDMVDAADQLLERVEEQRDYVVRDLTRNCSLPHHNRGLERQLLTLGTNYTPHQSSRTVYTLLREFLPVSNEFPFGQMLRDNPVNLFRIFGFINATPSRHLGPLLKSYIIQHLQQYPQDTKCIVIGDGIGGVTRQLFLMIPNISVIFCTMSIDIDSGNSQSDAPSGNFPLELQNLTYDLNISSRLFFRNMYPGDITQVGVRQCIKSTTDSVQGYPRLMVSDMDWPLTDNEDKYYQMLYSLMEIINDLLNPDLSISIKLNLRRDIRVSNFLYWIACSFSHFHVYHGVEVSFRTHEVIIVATKCIKLPLSHRDLVKFFEGSIMYYHSPNVSGLLMKQLTDINKSKMLFHYGGKFDHPRVLNQLIHLAQHQIFLRPLRQILRATKVDTNFVRNYNGFLPQALLASLDLSVDSICRTLLSLFPKPHRGNVIGARVSRLRATTGTQLAEGMSTFLSTIEILLFSSAAAAILRSLTMVFNDIRDFYAQIWDLFLDELTDKFIFYQIPFNCYWCEYQIFIYIKNHTFNLTTQMQIAFKHVERIVSWCYTLTHYAAYDDLVECGIFSYLFGDYVFTDADFGNTRHFSQHAINHFLGEYRPSWLVTSNCRPVEFEYITDDVDLMEYQRLRAILYPLWLNSSLVSEATPDGFRLITTDEAHRHPINNRKVILMQYPAGNEND